MLTDENDYADDGMDYARCPHCGVKPGRECDPGCPGYYFDEDGYVMGVDFGFAGSESTSFVVSRAADGRVEIVDVFGGGITPARSEG